MALVIEIPCPNCERVLKVPESVFGKKIKCKHCGEPFQVEDPDTLEEEEAKKSKKPRKEDKPAVKASKPGGAVKKKEEPKPEAKPEQPAPAASTYKFDEDEGEGGAKMNPLGVVDAGEDVPRCPHCAKELEPPNAVVCVHCGFNNVTRVKADSKRTWAPDASDWLSHLGPGVIALLIAIGLLVLNIVCIVNMRDWLTGTFLEKDEKGADGQAAFYVKPGAFIAFIIAADILPLIALARFGIKRCFINYRPEEKVKT